MWILKYLHYIPKYKNVQEVFDCQFIQHALWCDSWAALKSNQRINLILTLYSSCMLSIKNKIFPYYSSN